MAALGNSGIPQDTRLLFKALSADPAFDVSGLLMESQGDRTRRLKPPLNRKRPEREILDASHYFLGLSGIEPVRPRGRFQRLFDRFELIARTYMTSLQSYELRQVPPHKFEAAAWRQLFQKSLSARDRSSILSRPLLYTNLTLPDLTRAAMLPGAPQLRLNTSGFDAVVFQDARPIIVSPGTRKFIRYHDAIPLIEPDLLGDGTYSTVHYIFLERCRRDSYFVCNSETTRRDLCSIFPDLEARSTVIPCAMEPAVSAAARAISIPEVVRTRVSFASLGRVRDPLEVRREVLDRARLDEPFRYILAVSAIEPKKNVPTIVRAWERLRTTQSERVRLVIVGKSSWNTKSSFAAMRPHVLSGDLYHLEDLPFVELQALMLHAEALAFPSYAEGFGYPPAEALVAGTPSVASDLPAIRETLGEGAIYVDPYDVQSVANGLEQLVFGENRVELRRRIVEAGQARLSAYRPEAIAESWRELVRTVPTA
jgi:glycosyltransferase involved in cell wall biosynthesis